MTTGGFISDPEWSPSGKEIAFVDDGSVNVIGVKTRRVRRLSGLRAYHPKESERTHDNWDLEFFSPHWSPNGKVIAAEGWDDATDGWITAVDARSGKTLFRTLPDTGGSSFDWSEEGELIYYQGSVKVTFDWTAVTNRSYPASGRLFLFKQNGKFGYLDNKGKTAIKPQFSDAGQFSEGLAPIAISGKWGYINTNGKLVIQPRFDAAPRFSRGLARVKVDRKWRRINKRGKFVDD